MKNNNNNKNIQMETDNIPHFDVDISMPNVKQINKSSVHSDKVSTQKFSLGLKLDLGSGNNPRHGFESVDLFAPNAKWKQNLLEFPWPWGDEQVAELHCSHFIEHIPMAYINSKNEITLVPTDETSIDLMNKFFDECYRVLQPNGRLTLQWPCSRSDRAFQDPTHRRFIPETAMLYLNKQWREAVGLGHYLSQCNFTDGNGGMPIVTPLQTNPEFQLYSNEAAMRRMRESWNVITDFTCTLFKEAN